MDGELPEGFKLEEAPAAQPGQAAASGLPEGFQLEGEKYSTPLQQLGTAAEGLGQGVAGPLFTGAELGLSKLGVPNLTSEDITGRQEANPWTHGIAEATGLVGPAVVSLGGSLAARAGLEGVGALAAGARAVGNYTEAGLLGKLADRIVPEGAGLLGKIGSGALKGAIEAGVFQEGDELSKAMLGQGDPEAPVASALANGITASGMGAFLGAAFGGAGWKLKTLADAKAGSKASQAIEDFGNRWKYHTENPDLLGSVTKELTDFHGSTNDAADEIRGVNGLKSQAVDQLSTSVTPEAAASHVSEVMKELESAPKALKSDPLFQSAVEDWKSRVMTKTNKAGQVEELIPGVPKVAQPEVSMTPVRFDENPLKSAFPWLGEKNLPPKLIRGETQPIQREMLNPNPSEPVKYTPISSSISPPSEIFKATDQLKRQLQEWGQYNKAMVPLSETPFRNASKSLGYTLRNFLEDSGKWGDLGELQKGVNKATSDFIPKLKDFNSTFSRKVEGVPTIDPGKVNTYVNQLGKPSAEIKQEFMKNFIDSAEKFRTQIDEVHRAAGVESPLTPISMNAVKGTYGDSSAGSKFADYLYNKGIPSITDPLVGRLSGSAVGGALAGPAGAGVGYVLSGPIDSFIEHIIGRPISNSAKKYVVPGILKALSSETSGGILQVLDHANDVQKGAQRINSEIESIFRGTSQQTLHSYESEKDREKIKKFIERGGVTKQVQDQLNHSNKVNPSPTQSFASGGEVAPDPISSNPGGPLFKGTEGLSKALPDQNMMMQVAKGRVSNYLNSLRPQQNLMKLPFDKDIPSKEKERTYNQAIDIAAHPLGILDSVRKGNLTVDKMKHFTQLYPELYSHLSKKITERISQGQSDDETPSYKARQAMSVFLGVPVDSTMTPQSMASIQSVFSRGKTPPQPQKKSSGSNVSKLDKLDTNLRTTDQSRTVRANKS